MSRIHFLWWYTNRKMQKIFLNQEWCFLHRESRYSLHVIRFQHLFQTDYGENGNNGKMSKLQWHLCRYSISSRDQSNHIVIQETPYCIRVACYVVNADTCKRWSAISRSRNTCVEWKCTRTHTFIHKIWKWYNVSQTIIKFIHLIDLENAWRRSKLPQSNWKKNEKITISNPSALLFTSREEKQGVYRKKIYFFFIQIAKIF